MMKKTIILLSVLLFFGCGKIVHVDINKIDPQLAQKNLLDIILLFYENEENRNKKYEITNQIKNNFFGSRTTKSGDIVFLGNAKANRGLIDRLLKRRVYPFAGISIGQDAEITVRELKSITGNTYYKAFLHDISICIGVIKKKENAEISIDELSIEDFDTDECDSYKTISFNEKDQLIAFMAVMTSAFPNIKY